LGAEYVFMQTHHWRFAGRIVGGDHVKSARAFGDAAFHQEVLRGYEPEGAVCPE